MMIHWQVSPLHHIFPLLPQDLTQVLSLKCLATRCLASKVPILPSPVIAHVEGIKALGEALHIGGADSLQEVDVVLRVEAAHVMLGGLVWLEDLGWKHKVNPSRVSPTHWAETAHTEPRLGDCPKLHTAVPSPPNPCYSMRQMSVKRDSD